MSSTNIFQTFSESNNGMPIVVTSRLNPDILPATDPGVLIHRTTTELDSLWVWASLDSAVSYLEPVFIRVLKGNDTVGFVEDSLVKVTAGSKVILETGVIITGTIEYRVYIDSELSSLNIDSVSITGYVHRRI